MSGVTDDAHPTDPPNPEATGVGMAADPDALDRAGTTLNDRASEGRIPIDRGLLRDDVIGHAGLAHALRDFVDTWEDRLGHFDTHLSAMGDILRQSGQSYRDTDDTVATNLARLDRANLPDTEAGGPR